MRYLALQYTNGQWRALTSRGRLIVTTDPAQVRLAGRGDGPPPPLIAAKVLGVPHVDVDDLIAESRIGDTLAHAGHNVDRMPMGVGCAVHHHREWVPIERHHVWPKGLGGPDVDTNKVSVCANGHYSIHAYLDLLMKHDGQPPYDQGKHFGDKVVAYALRGWTEAGKPTHGGGE